MADEDEEEILDSWEDALDSEDLERRMELREKQLREQNLPEELEMNTGGQIKILRAEDSTRTAYSPQIKILKRSNLSNANQVKPKNKTEAELKENLKVREAEYKAARNRIMGEDYDETKAKLEVEEAKISIKQNPSRASPVSPSSPVTVLSPKTKVADFVEEHIVRQPRGPDDTAGFQLKR